MKNSLRFSFLGFMLFFCVLTNAQTTTPFSSKIIATYGSGTSSINPAQNVAHICPGSGDYAVIKAYAGWPFGTGSNFGYGSYLHVIGTLTLPCGSVTDFDSIRIEAGGKLIISDYNGADSSTATQNPWTIIGCRYSFVNNGIIEAKNGTHHGGIFQLFEPDDTGHLTIQSPIVATIFQGFGGNGGYGGGASDGSQFSPTASGGSAYHGNGGGGGGGGSYYGAAGGCQYGVNGVAANDTLSGAGGFPGLVSANLVPGVTLYSHNGNSDFTYAAVGNMGAGSFGGSGGTRGKHGGLLFIKAMQSIIGAGTIDVSGDDGGNGGASANNVCGGNAYSGIGGGGGGGAGGSGGYVYIKYVGVVPTISINISGGNGGLGGTRGAATLSCQFPGDGQNGFNGDNGQVGQIQSTPINGYTYQWRKGLLNIAGANKDTLQTNQTGFYDCKINQVYTSGPFNLLKDTVIADNTPTALIQPIQSHNSCTGQNIVLTATYIAGQTYQWLLNGNPILGANSNVYSATQSGNYVVVANNACNSSNPSSTETLVFHAPPAPPVVTPNGLTTFCNGGNVILQSSSLTGNLWSTGSTSQSISVNQSGTYTCTYTDNNGCSATSAGIAINVKSASVNAGNDTALYCGNSFTINPIYNPPNPTSVSWTPAQYLSSASSPNPLCKPSHTTSYVVNAILNNGCPAKDTIIVSANAAINPGICLVTVDSLSQHNVIVWEKQPNVFNIDSFRIYRQDASQYNYVTSVSYNQLSEYTDIDPSVNPQINFRFYKLATVDTCTNVSALSDFHKTILLTDNNGVFTYNTNDIQNQATSLVDYYELQRYDSAQTKWIAINTNPGNVAPGSYQIVAPNYSSYQYSLYRIVANLGTYSCTPTARIATGVNNTRSNIKNKINPNAVFGNKRFENQIKLQPNPATDIVQIMSGVEMESIRVCNYLGQEVLYQKLESARSKKVELSVSALASGVYTVVCKGKEFEVRKKLVVE